MFIKFLKLINNKTELLFGSLNIDLQITHVSKAGDLEITINLIPFCYKMNTFIQLYSLIT